MAQDPPHLQGVALITGSASGIGRATAHTFVKEGCTRLVLADLDPHGLQTVSDELHARNPSVKVLAIRADVSVESDVVDLIRAAVTKFGAVHYAVNNAGVTSNPRVRTDELPTEAWDRVVNVNLRGLWLCQREELRQMMRQGRDLGTRTGAPPQRGSIVNVSSVFGVITNPTIGGYGAAKAGVLGQTRIDAVAYAADGIRVNAVLPGAIRTALTDKAIRLGADYNKLVETIPVRRWGTPEEIAEAIVFLSSEKASLITGSELLVDGGFSKL